MKKRHFEMVPQSEQSLRERLRRFPAEHHQFINIVRAGLAIIIRALLRLYCRFEIIGHENIRTNRSLVIVANHSSHLDSVCLLAALPLRKLHRAYPAAAADYFFQSISRTWIASVIVNALPFARQHHVRGSLAACRELLSDTGNILIVFPEGSRSADGAMQAFKPGVGALVAGRDLAVLPCYLEGTSRVWPKGKCIPRPHKVRLIIGAPRNYTSFSQHRCGLEAIAHDLHAEIAALKVNHEHH